MSERKPKILINSWVMMTLLVHGPHFEWQRCRSPVFKLSCTSDFPGYLSPLPRDFDQIAMEYGLDIMTFKSSVNSKVQQSLRTIDINRLIRSGGEVYHMKVTIGICKADSTLDLWVQDSGGGGWGQEKAPESCIGKNLGSVKTKSRRMQRKGGWENVWDFGLGGG